MFNGLFKQLHVSLSSYIGVSDPEQNPRNPILIKDEKDFLNFIASFKTCYLYCGVCLFLTL